jgi:hypothetical protein
VFVIFAGAGASKAVNPEKYPTTVEFFDKLPPAIKESSIFGSIVDFLKQSLAWKHQLSSCELVSDSFPWSWGGGPAEAELEVAIAESVERSDTVQLAGLGCEA